MNGYRFIICMIAMAQLSGVLGCTEDNPSSNDGQDATVLDSTTGDINTDGLTPTSDTDSPDESVSDSDDPSEQTDPAADPAVDWEEGDYSQRFDECGEGLPPCEPPLVCFGTCQLPCSAGCPGDEECIEFEEMPGAGICGVRVGVGEECDFDQGLFCEEDLYCDEDDGICRQEGVAGAGDPCGGDVICGDGMACVYYSWGEGFCHPTCNDDPTSCGEGYVCISTMGSGNVCYEDCDPDTDPECDNEYYECREDRRSGETACLPRMGTPPGDQEFGEACDDENACIEGLICTPLIPGAYCTQNCGDGNPCPADPPGAECVFSFCLFSCPGGVTECPDDMVCEDFFGQDLCHW